MYTQTVKTALLFGGAMAMAVALSGCMGQANDHHHGERSSKSKSSKSSAVASSKSSLISSSSLATSSSKPSSLASSSAAPDVATFSKLSDGTKGGSNIEGVYIDEKTTGFDKDLSYKQFVGHLYPLLKEKGCNKCHSSDVAMSDGGRQAPLLADSDPELAHEYALTAVNFKTPAKSKLVEHIGIYRHYCPDITCASSASQLSYAIENWARGVTPTLPKTPDGVPTKNLIDDEVLEGWINEDKANLTAAEAKYFVYASLHELHNVGKNADQLNIVRVALSKILNSTARWAPTIVNPVDVNGKGLLYRFDIRDYWGYNQGVTKLLFGGSDDDLAFGNGKKDYLGNAVTAIVQQQKYDFTGVTKKDPEHALRIWERILHGNIEGAVTSGTIAPNIDGFIGSRKANTAGEYVDVNKFKWVEASQLVYTLSRPDVYNAVMTNPFFADELEDNLNIVKDKGMDSYDYWVTRDASTVDSRFMFRANTANGGMLWKTFEVFTADTENGNVDMREVYANAEGNKKIRFPFWANPIPQFTNWKDTKLDDMKFSFVATLAQAMNGSSTIGQFTPSTTPGCDPMPSLAGSTFNYCRHYTGTGGFQQSESQLIYTLTNGLHGYLLAGGQNQRRLDTFQLVYRDPRLIPTANDDIVYMSGYGYTKNSSTAGGVNDPRLNVGASCFSCHSSGINRVNNDLREWLDNKPEQLPVGQYGADSWIGNAATVARVRDLYKPNSSAKPKIESDRYKYLQTMSIIQNGMVWGKDKNIYVEPVVWTADLAKEIYRYKTTTSN
jgi:hypothetical protein